MKRHMTKGLVDLQMSAMDIAKRLDKRRRNPYDRNQRMANNVLYQAAFRQSIEREQQRLELNRIKSHMSRWGATSPQIMRVRHAELMRALGERN